MGASEGGKTRPKATLQIKCDCSCSILEIEKWEDEWGIACISLYEVPHNQGMNLWWRFSQAWRTFWNGQFSISEIVIENNDLDRLREFLAELTVTSQGDFVLKEVKK
jgi:hypothetical protein